VGVVHSAGGVQIGRGRVAPAGRGTRAAGRGLIAADIRLAPGNSGGPLATARGEVVGINSMIANGLGLAIPSETVTRFLAAQAPRPRLGVALRPVEVRLRGRRDDATVGLLVLELTQDGAAQRAGLLPGDVLLGAAGVPFASADDLLTVLARSGAGATVHLDVGRAGRRTVVAVPLPAAGDSARPRRAA
jgi:serine protease Do